jgi:CheY-like chemotaxis protein
VANVFLVEDDLAYLYAARRVLEGLGHLVTSHANSVDAWDAITSGASIDLLLVDLRFPPGQPNGVALAHHARMKKLGVPVVFMTAHANSWRRSEMTWGRSCSNRYRRRSWVPRWKMRLGEARKLEISGRNSGRWAA